MAAYGSSWQLMVAHGSSWQLLEAHDSLIISCSFSKVALKDGPVSCVDAP